MNFFGYNIFQYSPAFIEHMERLKPAALLFLDNDGGAADAARRLPTCNVIARQVSDKYEKQLHYTTGEAVKYVQRRASEVDRRCYINIGCEPPTDRLDLLVSEYIKALDWAEPRGIKIAAPHLAHYGLWDDEFRALMPLAERIASRPDLFLFTADEYFAGVPFSGVQDARLAGTNETAHVRPETWKRSPSGVYYHIGRIGRLFEIMKAEGKTPPPTVITEGGPDDLQDVEVWRESLIHTPPYDKIKGWRTLVNQWRIWGEPYGWSAQRYFVEGLTAIRDEIYGQWPNVIAYLLFVEGNNGDPLWLGHETNDPELRTLLEASAMSEPVPTPTPLTPDAFVSKPADAGAAINATLSAGYKVRAGNGTLFAVRGFVPAAGSVVYYPTTERDDVDPAKAPRKWVWVEASEALAGWMASEAQFVVPLPEPPQDPEPPEEEPPVEPEPVPPQDPGLVSFIFSSDEAQQLVLLHRLDAEKTEGLALIGADIAAMFALLAEKLEVVSLMEMDQARIKRQIADIIEAAWRRGSPVASTPATNVVALETNEETSGDVPDAA